MIEFKNVVRRYVLGGEEWVLGPLNFTVQPGEKIAILGSSGSGKSTLLHLLGRLDTATEGEIIVNNNNIKNFSREQVNQYRKQTVGFIFQDFHLFPEFTAYENVYLSISLLDNLSYEQRELKVNTILDQVGILNKKNNLPKELSGGQQQRVAIARALCTDPQILLADEPTGNLDAKTGKKILDLLFKVSTENNSSFLCVTHDENIATKFDRIIRVEDGKLL